MTEVVLEPGDVLYLPSGVWHATESHGGPALSLSFSMHGAPFDELLGRYLRRALDAYPWRQNLPPSTFELAGGAASPSARALRRFVGERLREAARAIDDATPDDVLAAIFEHAEPVRAGASDEASPTPVDADDVLALNPAPGGVISTRTEAGETSVFVHHGGVELELPGFTAPFFFALAAKRRFRAGDAPSLFAKEHGARWEEVRPLLSLLLAHGILVAASSAADGAPPRVGRRRA